jgi:hypothetical protein
MRIAMIAMSGIRCCDQELMRMGLTLPGFVERSQTLDTMGVAVCPSRVATSAVERPVIIALV